VATIQKRVVGYSYNSIKGRKEFLEVVYEDLARQNTAAPLFQLSYGFCPRRRWVSCLRRRWVFVYAAGGFRRRRTWVSGVIAVPEDSYIGRRTAC
jgi:hypothetical protein